MASLRETAALVDGARQLHESGGRIARPDSVDDATQAYRTESDVLGAFVSDECVLDEKGFVLTAELYAVYKSWCDDNGERAISKKALGLRLQEMGFTPAQDRRGARMWRGLCIAGHETAKFR